MAYNAFRPKPGRHGIEVVYIATPLVLVTSTLTEVFNFPTPFRKAYILSASVQCQTAPIITTGTSTATLKKRQASDASVKVLSSGFDLETLTANKASPMVIPVSTVEGDKFVRNTGLVASGDILYIETVTGTTVATAPVGLHFVVELAILQ